MLRQHSGPGFLTDGIKLKKMEFELKMKLIWLKKMIEILGYTICFVNPVPFPVWASHRFFLSTLLGFGPLTKSEKKFL
jgi:hypothetical protein